MVRLSDITKGARVIGLVHDEPVEVIEITQSGGAATIIYRDIRGHVDSRMVFKNQEDQLKLVETKSSPPSFDVEANKFRLVAEAYRLKLAHLFDPMLAVHVSLVDPLPHQITAVYDEMILRQPLRFLLADDPGAGKTIMAGLLVKELIARGDVERCLVCCPGSLAEQWQDEMRNKFNLGFQIITRDLIESDLSGNPFTSYNFVIGKMDQLSRSEDVKQKVNYAKEWDLVIVDEAHKLSCPWYGNEPKPTLRYLLGKQLAAKTRNLLLLTATPHNGKDEDFQSFLQILDPDRFEGKHREGEPVGAQGIMRRMIKEDLVKFDGTPLFPERKAYTPQYDLTPEEFNLYNMVSDYVSNEMNRVERLNRTGQGKRGAVVGFALTAIQRRLASSPEAIYQTLIRRRENLEQEVERYRTHKSENVHPGENRLFSDIDEDGSINEEEYSEEEFADIESYATSHYSTAETIGELEKEIESLKNLETNARLVRESAKHGKWSQLSEMLKNQRELFDNEGNRLKLIIFTEYRDTLRYLVDKIRTLIGKPEAVVTIHGGMKRDDRRNVQEKFVQDKDTLVLVATDAAGEGVNLQRAHLMINYDIPWNPNRLEQRFGRIHRIGQTEVCHMWNLVAKDTREGDVLKHLFDKLKLESEALGDKVFDVLGRAIDAKDLKDLMLEAIRYGNKPEVKARLFQQIEGRLDRKHIEDLLEERALTHDSMDASKVQRIREEAERAETKKLQPHFIQSFFLQAFKSLGGSIHERESRRFEITNVPTRVRRKGDALSRNGKLLTKYERITFNKDLINTAGKPTAEFVCPGHPLLDACIDLILEENRNTLQSGSILVDPSDEGTELRSLWFIQSELLDGVTDSHGNNRVISKHLHFIDSTKSGSSSDAGYAPYLDYRPLRQEESVEGINKKLIDLQQDLSETMPLEYVSNEILPVYFQTERERRERIVEKTQKAVRERLIREINVWDRRANDLQADEARGKKTRLSSIVARKRADELRDRLDNRMNELDKELNINMRPPIVIGKAIVIPKGLLREFDSETSDGHLFSKNRDEVDRRAIEAVIKAEKGLGRIPKTMPHNNPGYDIESYDPENKRLLFIEVKGRIEGERTVTISRTEIMTGLNKPDTFVLALVTVTGSGNDNVTYVTTPFEKEPEFNVVSMNFDLKKLIRKGGEPF